MPFLGFVVKCFFARMFLEGIIVLEWFFLDFRILHHVLDYLALKTDLAGSLVNNRILERVYVSF